MIINCSPAVQEGVGLSIRSALLLSCKIIDHTYSYSPRREGLTESNGHTNTEILTRKKEKLVQQLKDKLNESACL